MPVIKPVVSVVLGSYNRKNFLKLTVKGVRAELLNLNLPSEIIIVDGGSSDGTIQWLTKQKDIISIIQHNRGTWLNKPIKRRSWGYFMNLAFKAAQGKYICMLSDDCLVNKGAIVNAYNSFEKLLSEGKKIGAMAFHYRDWPEENDYHVNFTIDNTMVINHGLFLKEALEKVGYINENDFLFYHADDDLALKMKQAEYIAVEAKESFIEHFLHANIVLRQQVYENERHDYHVLIEKWKNIFKIEDVNNIHKMKMLSMNLSNDSLKSFYKLYKKDLRKQKTTKILKQIKRHFVFLFLETFYIIKYFLDSLLLLFTNPIRLKKKISDTYKKYFKS